LLIEPEVNERPPGKRVELTALGRNHEALRSRNAEVGRTLNAGASMLKEYAVCWSLVAAATLIGQAPDNVRLSFKREYGRALYRECRLDVTIFEARGRAALQCTYNVEPARILHAERALAQPEVTQLVALARASDLCTEDTLALIQEAGMECLRL
jgi:hypothetical protein